ncbi:5'-3' exodeoxyribonuclease [Aureococcus anophagefferens]|nr:5'-3' exodeoxyribonuclease [Aureococcus anophagefferens]
MGVRNLLPTLGGSTQTVHVSRYANQVVAIDANGWLHRGVHACATELGSGGTSDKHIKFCMRLVALLLHHKVKPFLVFDGGALPAKAAEEASRRDKREHAKAMANQKKREGLHEDARDWYAKAVDVTPLMAKELIDACVAQWGDSVDFLVAPYEADAQLAQLALAGDVAAVVSEDSDNLAYGVPRVLLKFQDDGNAEQIVLADLFAAGPGVNKLDLRGWTQDMFVTMCALAGCDYVEAVKGVGIKTAHHLVARYKDRKKVLRALRAAYDIPDDYEARVDRAALTFGHQMVYDRRRRAAVHLAPLPEAAARAHGPWPDFLGAPLAPAVATGIAVARLHPTTLQPFSGGKRSAPRSDAPARSAPALRAPPLAPAPAVALPPTPRAHPGPPPRWRRRATPGAAADRRTATSGRRAAAGRRGAGRRRAGRAAPPVPASTATPQLASLWLLFAFAAGLCSRASGS